MRQARTAVVEAAAAAAAAADLPAADAAADAAQLQCRQSGKIDKALG